MNTPPLLAVTGLRVEIDTRHGPTTALDGVQLTLVRGESLGLVGESGAGKSLTGAAIIGLLDPPLRQAAGEIRLDGERIDGLPEAAWRRLRGRRIGAVFQDPMAALDPLFTVGDQLVETLRAHLPLDRAAARQRALELLREVGLPQPEARLDQHPHQLSGGLRQRVVIALALAADPQLVIADEPTTALDVSTQAQVLATFGRLCRERGTALLLVTHDIGVVAEHCDRVAVMYAGRVVEIGAVTLLQAPAHPYTAGLVAAVPDVDTDRDELAQIDGTMPALGAWPSGCPFHPRCPHAFERCRIDRPPMFETPRSLAACWLHAGTSEVVG